MFNRDIVINDPEILIQEEIKKVEKISDKTLRDDAWFRIAKMYYETAADLDSAVTTVNKINNSDERNRCLVHLANAVLEKEKDVEKADKIVKNIQDDKYGYLKYYQKNQKN